MNGIIFLMPWLTGALVIKVGLPMVRRGTRLGPLRQSLFITALAYALLLAAFGALEWYLEMRLDAFDVNNDGVFDFAESTPTQNKLFDRLVNDSGRNLMRLFGLPVMLVLAVCTEMFLKLIREVRKRRA